MRNKHQVHSDLAELDLVVPCFVFFHAFASLSNRKSCLHMCFENALFGDGLPWRQDQVTATQERPTHIQRLKNNRKYLEKSNHLVHKPDRQEKH